MASIINLKEKKGIILGIANDKSIAWGIADQLYKLGANLAFSYVNESIKKRVIPLAKNCNSEMVFECDVKNDESIDNFFSEIGFNSCLSNTFSTIVYPSSLYCSI